MKTSSLSVTVGVVFIIILLLDLAACSSWQNNIAFSNKIAATPHSEKLVEIRPTPKIASDVQKKWQAIFQAEEPVEKPIKPPADVIAEITQSPNNIPDDCLISPSAMDSCFIASYVLINDDEFADIVVMGQGIILGANVTTFWVFRGTANGYRLILSNTGLQLVIGKKKTNDFLDIDIVGMSATKIYIKSFKFLNLKYKLISEKQEEI